MAIVTLPAMYVPDPSRSRALFYAKIYIGIADTDPTLPENQKPARLVQEDGSTVDSEYPIRTNEGGIPVYNGSEVTIDVDGDYSMAILDRNDSQIYYFANQVESSTVLQSNLNTIATLVDLTYDDIGVRLVTDEEGTSLDDAIILFNTSTGEVFDLPRNFPAGSEVVSVSGNQLITTNGTFIIYKREFTNYVDPLNNDWNGFFDPEHTVQIQNEDTSAGTRSFAANTEIAPNIFVTTTDSVTFSSTGWDWAAPQSIYKPFTFTAEHLALIDETKVPVYIKGQDGSRYLVKHNGSGVVVTKPDSTTLKVELTNAIFTELGITKVWEFFVTDGVGYVARLGVDATCSRLNYSVMNGKPIIDVTANRALGLTYTNNTKFNKEIYIRTSFGSDSDASIFVNNIELDRKQVIGSSSRASFVFTVRPGWTYRAESNIGLDFWRES